MEDTFNKEINILETARIIFDQKKLSGPDLWEEYGGMVQKYEELLHLANKMTRIGDRYQKKAILANEALKHSEQKLRELNATKDTFFSIIAHDLKNPLTIIMGFSDLLVNAWDAIDEEKRRAQIKNISNSSNNLFKLLTNLLEWARLQTGSIGFNAQKNSLAPVIKETVSLLEQNAKAKEIRLECLVSDDVVAVLDRDMITTVVRNLVSNAIKFTPRGGTVRIESQNNKDNTQISVIDSGVGIKEKDLEKLFRIDTHYTTRGTSNEKGTGLGLILCKEFIEKHRGRIWVESEPGKGSSFIFTLPAV